LRGEFLLNYRQISSMPSAWMRLLLDIAGKDNIYLLCTYLLDVSKTVLL